MPILSRFLPTETTLVEMTIERLDPERARRIERFTVIRRMAASVVMAMPAYFVGGFAQLVQLRVVCHFPIPLLFWIREPAMLVLTSWIAYEMFHVERCYRRYGL